MLDELPGNMAGEAAMPAANHLLTINKDPVLLDEGNSEMFHRHMAKLLFLSKRA